MSLTEKLKTHAIDIVSGVLDDPRTETFVDKVLVGKVFPFIKATAISTAEAFSDKIINRVLDLDQDGQVDAVEVIQRVDQAVDAITPQALRDLLDRTGLGGIFTDWIKPRP